MPRPSPRVRLQCPYLMVGSLELHYRVVVQSISLGGMVLVALDGGFQRYVNSDDLKEMPLS